MLHDAYIFKNEYLDGKLTLIMLKCGPRITCIQKYTTTNREMLNGIGSYSVLQSMNRVTALPWKASRRLGSSWAQKLHLKDMRYCRMVK